MHPRKKLNRFSYISADKKPHLAMRLFELIYEGFVYTWNEDPHPQVLFTFGFSNLKPAPSRLST